jgi:hypothetical protein
VAVAVNVVVPPTLSDDAPPPMVTPARVRVVPVPDGPVGLLPEQPPTTTAITDATTNATPRAPTIAILLLEGEPGQFQSSS